EYREHRSIWIAMAALAVLCLGGLLTFVEPAGAAPADSEKWVLLLGAAAILATTYGLVCGSMMLAGESEAGTLTFLDTLPRPRRQLWLTKMVVGAILTTLQAAFLAALFTFLTDQQRLHPRLSWSQLALGNGGLVFLGLLILASDARCWGMLFSAY